MSGSPSFTRASNLFDAHHNQRIPWDWTRDQPLAESFDAAQLDEPTGATQSEVDEAIEAKITAEGR